MLRRLVGLVPQDRRLWIIRLLPYRLHEWLQARYRRDPLSHRLRARLSAWRLRRRHPELLAAPKVTVRRIGKRAWVCREVGRASVESVRAENLDRVVVVLQRLGAEHFVVNTGSPLRHTVGVPARFRSDVLRHLRDRFATEPVYVSVTHDKGRRTRHVLAAEVSPGKLAGTSHVRVSTLCSSPCGNLVLGVAHGCELEFWEERGDGALVSPRPNRVAALVPAPERRPATVVVRDRTYPTLEPFARTAHLEVRFPVDVVYTWVDGEDPAWRAKKDRYLALHGLEPLNSEAANSARYLSRDELRYSLRSLEMYADWFRTVYLVTDDQVPQWLDTSHPRLRLVSHRELFGDAGAVPTFNSHAIESRLHHIPGLSEQYLYLNDDVFFGRPVAPELFFHGNGVSKFFLSKAQLDLGSASVSDPPVMSAAKNNRELIWECFGRQITQKLKHVPHSQRRSVLLEMEERYREHFMRTSASRFRSRLDLSLAAALYHHYAYCTGRAVPGEIRYLYTDLSDPGTASRLYRLLRLRDFDVFCLNDTDLTGVDGDQQARMVRHFLDSYYPLPSSYERADESLAPRRGVVAEAGARGPATTDPADPPPAVRQAGDVPTSPPHHVDHTSLEQARDRR